MKKRSVLSPDIKKVLEHWHPYGWSEADLRTLGLVRDTVREWVTAAARLNPKGARRLLRATAGLTVWVHQTWGTTNVRTVLDPRNVEHWVMSINAGKSAIWRENTRGALRAVGRAVYPQGWTVPPPHIGRRLIAVPYSSLDETGFTRAARLAGRSNRAARLWVVGGAFGGGLYGREIAAATTHDFEEILDSRLVVTTRGPKARMVPIRRAYTKLVREALEQSRQGRFIHSTGLNTVYFISSKLDTGDGEGLSLRRARSTWLHAHLLAGTSLPVLQRIAGPLSANSVDLLLRDAAAVLDDETAVMEGLRV